MNVLLFSLHFFSFFYRQESDDELVESNFTSSFLNVSNHCYYHGSVQNDTFGYVAIDICAGIQGVIVAHDEILYIEPHAATEQPEASLDNMHATIHAITRADLPATMALDGNNSSFCGVHDEDEFEDSVEHERWHAEHDEDEEDEEEEESSESSDEPEQGGLWTIVPSTRTTRVRQKDKIQVLIVNDKTRYRSLGSQTEDSSLAILNLVAAYYRNGGFADPIEIELVGQITNNLQDPYTTKTSGGLVDPSGTYGLLGRFNYYRQRYASFLPSHDVAVLMSGKTFRSNILGLATVYSACMRDKSGVVTSLTPGSSQNVANAVIVAHEIGIAIYIDNETLSLVSTLVVILNRQLFVYHLITLSQLFIILLCDDFRTYVRYGS